MKGYREKSERVEAVRWDGVDDAYGEIGAFVGQFAGQCPLLRVCDFGSQRHPLVRPGDWIIRHPDGGYSGCANEDFHRKYESVDGPEKEELC